MTVRAPPGECVVRTANRPGPAGLYLIGAHAHPGGGLARVGMSASITAGLLGPA
jgi:phytoene dehydrogenase-like protein